MKISEIESAAIQVINNDSVSSDSLISDSTITIIAALVIIILHGFTIYKILKDLKYQRKLFIEGQNAKERDDIRYRLNHFFGPFKALRAESRSLYEIFALKEKKSSEELGESFRTLTHLTNSNDFCSKDKVILEDILKINEKLLDLIEKEGWTFSNSSLADLLGQNGAHIRVLSMAKDHKLDKMTSNLEHMVSPREIDGAIESEIRKLQDRYNELMGKVTNQKSRELSKKEQMTIDYYNNNAIKYYSDTAYIDLSEIYRRFTKLIPARALILDSGCGVGRDTRYFIMNGYRVISFDASKELSKMCQQYPFAYCLNITFDDLVFIQEFDAIWACASLIHVSKDKLLSTFGRLINATKEGGIIYFSLKEESQPNDSDGRQFYYHTTEEIEHISGKLSFDILETWKNDALKDSDNSLWTNYLCRRKSLI